jgi:hypothetical protein
LLGHRSSRYAVTTATALALALAAPCPLGCAHAAAVTPAGDAILDSGGELAGAAPERAAVVVTPEQVTVWGSAEVPDGSRLQVAYAGVDAITRSELLKAVQVRVTSVLTDLESTEPARRTLVLETVEAVDGELAGVGPLPHGWARVRRGNSVVLRVWARLDVSRARLERAVRPTLERVAYRGGGGWMEGLSAFPVDGPSR